MVYRMAQVYALRRDPENAFAWPDSAWANRDTGVPLLQVDCFLFRYRNDLRFTAFCTKAELPSTTEAKALP